MKFKLSNENQNILCASVCGVAGFAATYISLPGHGPAAGLCLLALCAMICAFMRGSIYIRLLAAPITSGITATVMADTNITAIIYAAVMLLMCAVFTFTVRYAFKKGIIVRVLAVIMSLAMFPINILLCGFITDALPAQRLMDEYISQVYGENSVLSPVYYNPKSGIYQIDAHTPDSPTEVKHIYVKNGRIIDEYIGFVEEKIQNGYVLQLTKALRTALPNESFEVYGNGIADFHSQKIDPLSETDFSSSASFTVHIGGMKSPSEFVSAVQRYADALYFSGQKYYKITFTGGNGQRDIYSVTVKNGFLLSRTEMLRVRPISRFGRRFWQELD